MNTSAEQMVERFRFRMASLRKAKGYSQQALANEIGVGRAAVSKMEVGLRSIHFDEAIAISMALGVSVDQMLGNEPLTVEVG